MKTEKSSERVGRRCRAHSNPEHGLTGIGVSAPLPVGMPGWRALQLCPVPTAGCFVVSRSSSTRRQSTCHPTKGTPQKCPLGELTLLRTSEVAGTEGPFCPQIPGPNLLPGQALSSQFWRCSLSVAMETGPCLPRHLLAHLTDTFFQPREPVWEPGDAGTQLPGSSSASPGATHPGPPGARIQESGRAEGSLPEWARREGGAGGWVRWGGAAAEGRGGPTPERR